MNAENVVLSPIKDTSVMELMFLKENDGKFRVDSRASETSKQAYIEFLLTTSEGRLSLSIDVDGVAAGFILVAGKDNRLVGGIYPQFQRKGIYTRARNAVVKLLNSKGVYNIVFSVDKSNKGMEAFIKSTLCTPYHDGLRVVHYDPTSPIARLSKDVVVGSRINSIEKVRGELFHLSFNPDLSSELRPALPAGSEVSDTTGSGVCFPEPSIPRISFAPSPELCFRAIYPNISSMLENTGEDTITMYLYKLVSFHKNSITYPNQMVKSHLVHDAHITLEHYFTSKVGIRKVGKITFKNTSDDNGLFYLPFADERLESRYHSPKVISVIS